jgi:hypothetical protein
MDVANQRASKWIHITMDVVAPKASGSKAERGLGKAGEELQNPTSKYFPIPYLYQYYSY